MRERGMDYWGARRLPIDGHRPSLLLVKLLYLCIDNHGGDKSGGEPRDKTCVQVDVCVCVCVCLPVYVSVRVAGEHWRPPEAPCQPSSGSSGGSTPRRREGGGGGGGGPDGRSVIAASWSAIHHQSLEPAWRRMSASSRLAERGAPKPLGSPGRPGSRSAESSATSRCSCSKRASAATARARCRSASSISLMTAGQCFGSTAPAGTALEAPQPILSALRSGACACALPIDSYPRTYPDRLLRMQ
jgi:hypothetical protein